MTQGWMSFFARRQDEIEVRTSNEKTLRGKWTGRFDFLLSCIGFAVGLGNVWRFPYLCYRNGGGVFLIPYVIFLFTVGVPIFLIEATVGQFSSSGPYRSWDLVPALRGIGVGMGVVSTIVGFYYNTIIAWAFWYFFVSFKKELPWTRCGQWSDPLCETNLHVVNADNCTAQYLLRMYENGTCYNTSTGKLYGIYNHELALKHKIKPSIPASDYLKYVGLQSGLTPGLSEIGSLRWDLSLCVLLAWVIIFMTLIKGIKTSGKVVYFTATFPYVILFILLIFGATRKGSADGIKFYLKPDTSKLANGVVWKDAATQIFFSLSTNMGGMVVYASYNRFHKNVVRDTFTVCFSNCLTSFFAGFVIFSFLGSYAASHKISVEQVAAQGVELAFVVYAQACADLPVGPLWAILFFFMLVMLGMDSEFSMIETIVILLTELYRQLLPVRKYVLMAVCFVMFICSLVMATPGGPHILDLLDTYTMGWNVILMAMCECAVVAIYGPKRFVSDIGIMIGNESVGPIPWKYLQWWFIACWCGFTPAMLLFIFIFSLAKQTYSHTALYHVLGIFISLSVIAPIVIVFIITIVRADGATIKEKFFNAFKPKPTWGPYMLKHRRLVTYVEGFEMNPRGTLEVEEENANEGARASTEEKEIIALTKSKSKDHEDQDIDQENIEK